MPSVNCTFWSKDKGLVQVDIELSSSLDAQAFRLLEACQQHAEANKFEYWAQPWFGEKWASVHLSSSRAGGFGRATKTRTMKGVWPNRPAAEMKLVHSDL